MKLEKLKIAKADNVIKWIASVEKRLKKLEKNIDKSKK
jgi:hypothetical protein